MHNQKIYKILYYLCFVLTIIPFVIVQKTPVNLILGIINAILFIVFIIKLRTKKLSKANILLPIIYLLFVSFVMIISIIVNEKLIIPFLFIAYYFQLVLFNYILLNIYSIVSLQKK